MKKKFHIFFILIVLSISYAYSQSSINNKYTENGILSYPQWEPELVIGRMDDIKISPFLKPLKSPPNNFVIDPSIKNLVTGQKGIRLNIPEEAFVYSNNKPVSGKVDINLIEVIDIFDFLTAGVGLIYYDETGKENLFESGGMLYVEANQGSKKLSLAKGKEIEVMIPDIFTSTPLNIYSMTKDGKWKLKEKNPLRASMDNALQKKTSSDVDQNSDLPTSAAPGDMPMEYRQLGVIITSIDSLGWINTDYPHPNFACLKGKITFAKNSPAKVVNVLAMGINHRSIVSSWTTTNKFEINVLKNKTIKILAIDNKGNIGLSETISTPDKPGHSKNPESPDNYKMNLEDISLKKIDNAILKDKQKFKDFLGIQDEYYMIRYPEKKKIEP
ncbi:MAG: hypothetical protein H7A23_12400 [Leptospiraceae bacterium]|nr:hypothetical protein [Leptospiraceae bacterium]MCP5495349.1 hypothetical protein [Leptospiraceae bacterium]